jgi:hypothetical protein
VLISLIRKSTTHYYTGSITGTGKAVESARPRLTYGRGSTSTDHQTVRMGFT